MVSGGSGTGFRKRGARLLWLGLIALGLVALVWLGITAYRGWRAASALLEDLDAIEALASQPLEGLDPAEAVDLLKRTRRDVAEIRTIARPFLWLSPLLGWVPRYGPEIQAAPDLLAIATNLTSAGDDLTTALAPLIARAASKSTTGQDDLLAEALTTLADAAPQLITAREALGAALAARDRLEVARLSSRVQSWVIKLDRYLPLMEQGVEAALLLPGLLRADGPRTYLILVQNEDELRATGGFISAVAQVTIEDGRIADLQVEDSYAVDDFSQPYPEPPAPLRKYMLADLWVFRDSNWSPDFPTSARAAIDLYAISRDADVDGVIALDQYTIRALVASLGPLQVEGFDNLVTGENVIGLAREAWAPGQDGADYEWWAQRKDFMADVLSAALARVEGGLDGQAMVAAARAGWRAASEKHLLVYLEDAEGAATLRRLGWDGSITSAPGDYLMVVDTNMGFNKVNGIVRQEIEYAVDLRDPSRPTATVVVQHQHLAAGTGECLHESRYDPTYEQMMQRCYWNFMRVVVPKGTQLLSATPHHVQGSDLLSGQPSPAQVDVAPPEAGREVLATFLLLRKGEALETGFELLLPRTVVRGLEGDGYEYELTVQKQPGTQRVSLRLSVALPPGATLVRSDPSPTSDDGDRVRYALTLETDQAVRIAFR